MLWRFVNGRQEAYCLLQHHPATGLEVRYIYNGVQLIGIVSPDVDELQQRAQQWRTRLEAEGWSEGERRLQSNDRRAHSGAVKVRRVGAKG